MWQIIVCWKKINIFFNYNWLIINFYIPPWMYKGHFHSRIFKKISIFTCCIASFVDSNGYVLRSIRMHIKNHFFSIIRRMKGFVNANKNTTWLKYSWNFFYCSLNIKKMMQNRTTKNLVYRFIGKRKTLSIGSKAKKIYR